MKILFAKLNIFLSTISILGIIVVSIFVYYINFNINFYLYLIKTYNENFLILVDKFFIFSTGIIGSIWTYINYKRTNNIQFVFFYCFICSFILEPISILKHYLLSHTLSLEFYYFMKFYHLISIFSLLNLFFLSLYICDFQIKSITYTTYLIFTFSMLYSSLVPINAYDQTNYLLFPTENNRFYVDLTSLLIPINILVAFSRKKNLNYLLIFISIFLIVLGIYLNSIEIPYAFIPSLIGVPMYLREAGKFFFYWL
ncbi:hypothetical protein BmHG_00413 [Borrelia miyamotoi]|uniref:hypothetical protein n=1 Tax=Borrelia miyamotoi TaxID=47466 RepID=UPI0004AD4938|nr:hypothetical protein EZU68_02250 [Borrelia miyamotoi]BCR08813.1 hypothetical protein BmHH_00410 [Borrelia miyamotoi]BCR09643.1 hypothetical protein BmHG_00413 [Borrelia miyamotoi]BCR10472.1 hypothetical protein BmHF_00411 [Borrelia miyamotoi]BCR11302.1 hypothetical protein BmHI_00412 [Borrelia miyamotoi]